MFVFDNVSDKDARSYSYELYEADQVSGSYPNISPITNATIYSSGTFGSNVFTVAVENSTDSTTRRYFGRIRTIDSSNNPSSWSPIVQSDQENPLISNQYIASLTAAKITAGTIGAHEIILTQAGAATAYSAPANTAVIRSSNYSANTAGWLIRGDGFAEFDQAAIRGTVKAGAVFIDEHNRWKANTTGSVISTAEFKVGNATKYVYWDGTNLTFTGNLSAAGGTFSGNLSAAGGTFSGELSGGTISIGSGNSIFKADSNGIYLGNSTFSSAPFRVTPQGGLVASNANITGTINATSGTISGNLITGGTISGTSIDINNGAFQVNSDGSLTATNADITGEINATSGSISGSLVTGTITAADISGVNITGVNITGSEIRGSLFENPSGRIVLPTDDGIIKLGVQYEGTATQCYIYAGGDQGLHVDTSGSGSSWIAGHTWYMNYKEFAYNRYITGLATNTGSGSPLYVSGGEVFRQASKRELKENIQNFNNISIIDSLRPVTFTWKAPVNSRKPETEEERTRRKSSVNVGFIAEEVEEASNGLLSVYNYEEGGAGEVEMYKHLDLLALAVASIQDLRKRVSELEKQ